MIVRVVFFLIYLFAMTSSRAATNQFSNVATVVSGSKAVDLTGSGRALVADAANRSAFTNPGVMTTTEGSASGLIVPAEKMLAWAPAAEWLICHLVGNWTPGPGPKMLMSFSYAQGSTGFALELTPSGFLQVVPRVSGEDKRRTPVSRLKFVSPGEQVQITMAFDPQTGSSYLYRGVELSNAFIANNAPGTSEAFSGKTQGLIRIGGASGQASTTMAGKFTAFHLYKGTGRLPVRLGSIVRQLVASPSQIVAQSLFEAPKERVLLGIGPAQSNEGGPGGGMGLYFANNMEDGAPLIDGLNATGGYSFNSPWPYLAAKLGERKKWLDVLNFGIGTTSLADVWVGRLRAYSQSMAVVPGSYILAGNGRVYKAMAPLGKSQGLFHLDVDPASGTGSSGLTSFKDMGPARPQDVNGTVYQPDDTFFDPNGLLAAERSMILARPGYDRKAVLVSIGQTDVSVETTRAQYSKAMQAVAKYFTSVGIHAFLAMTSTSPNSDAWFTRHLRPGRFDALKALAGNPLVHDGGDVAALGILRKEAAPQPAVMESTPALINNGGTFVHFNAAAQKLRAEVHAKALAAAGF